MPECSSKSETATAERARIIIVAYASGSILQACIDGLLAQTLPDFSVRIVDNGPDGDTAVDSLRGLDDRFEILKPGGNIGFAAGNNLGARGADSRWLVMLNPDAVPEPDWLETLVSAAEAHGAHMAGSLQLWRDRPGRLDGAGDAYHISGIAWRGLRGKAVAEAPPTGETFAPCGAAALVDRAAFEAVGGFDERFFAYHEDVDLAFRLRLRGARALQVQEAVVSHVSSGRPGMASDLAVRLGTRNRIWTFVRNMPLGPLCVLAPLHLAAITFSLARDARRGRGGAALRGIGEALSGLAEIWSSRKQVHAQRSRSSTSLLRAMTISPLPLLRTGADVRPWKAANSASDE